MKAPPLTLLLTGVRLSAAEGRVCRERYIYISIFYGVLDFQLAFPEERPCPKTSEQHPGCVCVGGEGCYSLLIKARVS